MKKEIAKSTNKKRASRQRVKDKAGRPPINLYREGETKETFWSKIDQWLMKGVAGTTIAYRLGCHADTFYQFGIKEGKWGKETKIPDFSAYKLSIFEVGNDTLRERQYDAAVGMYDRTVIKTINDQGQEEVRYETKMLAAPNITMQMFLGKNRLNQSDKQDITTNGKDLPNTSAPVTLQIITKPRDDKRS